MTSQEIRDLIGRYIEAFNARDFQTLGALFADDAVLEDPVGSSPIRGNREIRKFYEQFRHGTSSLKLDGEIRAATAAAAFPFLVDMGANHNNQTIEVIDTFIFDDKGRIREMRAFWGPGNVREPPSRAD
jgi:steroid delta-isomerase